ncbi:ankyrin repeat domain containing protein [Elaphomyces granulatus]
MMEVTINDKGFTVLVEPDNPVVDIVFIHGFTGHPKETWTLKNCDKSSKRNIRESAEIDQHGDVTGSSPLKYRRLLSSARREPHHSKTAPDARVLTYGYDTKIRHFAIGVVSQNTVHDHAWNFLCAAEELRRKEPLRPLLVAHSLGGLVVKEALRKSRDCESVKPHLHNVGVGVRFNDKVVDTLMPGGEHLKEMRDDFTRLVRQEKWIIYCFQEEYGLQGLFDKKVVDDESSRLDDPAIETPRHISSNHMNMCRFSSIRDPEYLKVAAAIEKILQDLPTKLKTGLARLDSLETGPCMPDVSSQWSRTRGNHQMDNFCPVPETSDYGQADARQNLIDLLHFDQKPEYIDWMCAEKLQEHHGFLWIKGKPGAGKSILMKFLFSDAKESVKSNPNAIIISFFFNARGDYLETSAVGLYRSLLLQVLEKAPDLRVVLDELDRNAQRLILDHGWQIETLKGRLAKAVEALGDRTLVCFIDALDECNEDQVADMISFFEDIGEHAADANTRLHICFSSRHYPTIIIQRGFEVTLEDEQEHAADITRYIKSRLRLGNSKQAEALRSDILEKSAGIFLWVALVIQILNKEYARGRVSELRDRLNDIPPGLDELFEMILTRDCENMEELQLCIQWVLFAVRPLKPPELYFAVRLGVDRGISTSWDKDRISLDDMHRFSKEPTVQFIHESVRDFLFKDGKRKLWPTLMEQFVGHGHEILKNCCLAQIDSRNIDILTDGGKPKDSLVLGDVHQAIQTEYPFLEYATANALEAFVTAFPLPRWIKLSNLFEKYQNRRYTNKASLLYILAERNLASLIEVHPHVHDHFNICGERYGYPFIAAAVLRNEDAIRELVHAVLPDQPGALSHLRDNLNHLPYGRGFQYNIGCYGLFSFLDKHGQTALSRAAAKGHEGVMKVLLEKGAELDSKSTNHRTPLSYAAGSGHEVVVKLLVEKGAELECKDEHGWTPLLWAEGDGHQEVVKLLVENGTDLECKGDFGYKSGCTALTWAASNGHEAVVKLLVEEGAELELVKLLLEKGVELECKDMDDLTPLSLAVRERRKPVVKLLLERGAKLDNDSKTMLLGYASSDLAAADWASLQCFRSPWLTSDSARAPWESWLASINDLRTLIDVEQLAIEHSRISQSAEAMPYWQATAANKLGTTTYNCHGPTSREHSSQTAVPGTKD